MSTNERRQDMLTVVAIVGAVAVVAAASAVGAIIEAAREWNSCWPDDND